ncbi:MAG TPA: hypothetical protein DC047_02380 [Blastocatellia bacterium]|nr:hypothetical protein [Blastocatellia bacterium]
MGLAIADCQLPISDWRLASGPIGNRQSELGNVGTHPLAQAVLTSHQRFSIYISQVTVCFTNKKRRPAFAPGVITGGTEVTVTIITYGHPINFKL